MPKLGDGRRPDPGVGADVFSRLADVEDPWPPAALENVRNRRLDHVDFPQVYFDVTYVRSPVTGDRSRDAVVTAIGVTNRGDAETLGVTVGDCDNSAFWAEVLADLQDRGLRGVELVICEPHDGLGSAVEQVFRDAVFVPTHIDTSPDAL